jgi:hypothetical protein
MKHRSFKIWGILWWFGNTNVTVEHLKVQLEVIVTSFV